MVAGVCQVYQPGDRSDVEQGEAGEGKGDKEVKGDSHQI